MQQRPNSSYTQKVNKRKKTISFPELTRKRWWRKKIELSEIFLKILNCNSILYLVQGYCLVLDLCRHFWPNKRRHGGWKNGVASGESANHPESEICQNRCGLSKDSCVPWTSTERHKSGSGGVTVMRLLNIGSLIPSGLGFFLSNWIIGPYSYSTKKFWGVTYWYKYQG